MIAVKGVNYVVLVNIDLIVNRQFILDKVNELFHLLAEELFDEVHEFDFQKVDPLLAGALLRPSLAPRARVDQHLHLTLSGTCHRSLGQICGKRSSIRSSFSNLLLVVNSQLLHVFDALAGVTNFLL